LSNVFIILVAGYETTSTALGYCTYRLAMHQDIQEKLYEELVEHWSSDTNSSYDVIMSKLTYMDLFVREVLRMHPIAIQIVNRQCMEDTHVVGYDIQKGFI
jgi:cytochrome P450